MDERKTRIRLKTFQEARQAVIQLQAHFNKEVVIIHDSAGFSLQCNLTLDEELDAYKVIPCLQVQTREKKPITKQEDGYVAIEFTHWKSIEDISDKISRPRASVQAILKRAGLWLDFEPIHIPDGTKSPPVIYGDGVLEFSDLELIWQIAPSLTRVIKDYTYEDISYFSSDELRLIISIMARWAERSDGSYHDAIELTRDARLHVISYQLIRCAGKNPIAGFDALKDANGLSPLLLYQREVLRAFATNHLLDYFPEEFLKNRSSTLIYGFGVSQFSHVSDDLLALIFPGNKKKLSDLAANGCRLAAWRLAEIFDNEILVGGNYRGFEAENIESIRGDFTPSDDMIREILSTHLSFDAEYLGRIKNEGDHNWRVHVSR